MKRLRVGATALTALAIAGAGLSTAHAQDAAGGSDGPVIVVGGSHHNVGVPAPAPGPTTMRKVGTAVTIPRGSTADGTATVNCDPGWVATGGGFHPVTPGDFRVIASEPTGGDANPTGWQIVFRPVITGSGSTAQAVVICVRA